MITMTALGDVIRESQESARACQDRVMARIEATTDLDAIRSWLATHDGKGNPMTAINRYTGVSEALSDADSAYYASAFSRVINESRLNRAEFTAVGSGTSGRYEHWQSESAPDAPFSKATSTMLASNGTVEVPEYED